MRKIIISFCILFAALSLQAQSVNGIRIDGGNTPIPVSYTHLDVYKRQLEGIASLYLLYFQRQVATSKCYVFDFAAVRVSLHPN